MALTGPRGEQQEQPRVGARLHGATFVRRELEEPAGPGRHMLLVGGGHVDLAVGDDQPGALVDLMLLQFLAGLQVERDRAALVRCRKDLRLLRLNIEGPQVPAVHRHLPCPAQTTRRSIVRASGL